MFQTTKTCSGPTANAGSVGLEPVYPASHTASAEFTLTLPVRRCGFLESKSPVDPFPGITSLFGLLVLEYLPSLASPVVGVETSSSIFEDKEGVTVTNWSSPM